MIEYWEDTKWMQGMTTVDIKALEVKMVNKLKKHETYFQN